MIPSKVRVLLTGGTFDKCYLPLTGEMGFESSVATSLFTHAHASEQIVIEELFLIDSLEMTEQHRQHIKKACEYSVESQLVIIHGTDTMTQTAEFLDLAQLNKTIILTGAMVPARLPQSDANFNLGYALAQAQCQPKGVYLAMNGQVFPAQHCKKNRSKGIFEYY